MHKSMRYNKHENHHSTKRSVVTTVQSQRNIGLGKTILGTGLGSEGIPRRLIRKTKCDDATLYLDDTNEGRIKRRYSPYDILDKFNSKHCDINVTELYTSGQVRCGTPWKEKHHRLNYIEMQDLQEKYEEVTLNAMVTTLHLDQSQLTPKEQYRIFSEHCQLHAHNIKNTPLDIEKPLSIFINHPDRKSKTSAQNTIMTSADHYILDSLPNRRPLEAILSRTVYDKARNSGAIDIGHLCSTIKANLGLNPYGVIIDSQCIPRSFMDPGNNLSKEGAKKSRCIIYHIDAISRYDVCLLFVGINYLNNIPTTQIVPEEESNHSNSRESSSSNTIGDDDGDKLLKIRRTRRTRRRRHTRLDKIESQLPVDNEIEGTLLNYFYFKCTCVKSY